MKQRKLLTSLFLAAALSISLLTGCGNTGSSTSETKHTENSATEEQTTSVQKESETDENQDAADQLLCDLKGTYQELRNHFFNIIGNKYLVVIQFDLSFNRFILCIDLREIKDSL